MPDITIEDLPIPSFAKIESEGDFKLTVSKAEWKPNASKPYFLLHLENDEEESILFDLYVTKESKWRLQEALFAFGIVKRGATGSKVSLKGESFLGAACNAEIKLEKWKDKQSGEEKSRYKIQKVWGLLEPKPDYSAKRKATKSDDPPEANNEDVSL
jgi:hypothetical protein